MKKKHTKAKCAANSARNRAKAIARHAAKATTRKHQARERALDLISKPTITTVNVGERGFNIGHLFEA